MNANENKKTKLVIFDFDGTLSKPDKINNTWARIWNKIDMLDEDDRLFELYKNKEITYLQWVDEIVKIFRNNNVTNAMFTSLANEIELLDNCEKVFKIFYENGIKICILSGGVKNIIEEKVKNFSRYITKIEAEFLTLDENGVVNGAKLSDSNIEDKSHFILKQMKEYDLKKEEVVFVGNSYNDEEAYKSGATTICINPVETDYTNKTIWTYYIEQTNDLTTILPFINI